MRTIINNNKYILIVVILCMANIVVYKDFNFNHRTMKGIKNSFPTKIPGWYGNDVNYDKLIIDILSPDIMIYKNFQRVKNVPLTLFIAFYDSAEKADLSHSPIVCFAGQGWNIFSKRKKNIIIDDQEQTSIKINRIEHKRMQTHMVTYYWYQSTNCAFTNRGMLKLFLCMKKLMGENEGNAFVRVTASGANKAQLEKAEAELVQFSKDFYSILIDFMNV